MKLTGRAKMHPRYVLPSSLRTLRIVIALHKRERESRASSLVTANYVSKRNSLADGKSLSRAGTSTRLRSSSPFLLRAWPTAEDKSLFKVFGALLQENVAQVF